MTGVRLTELVEAAGCAAKLPPESLAKVLADLPRLEDERLVVGFDASDDACVYDLGDGRGLVEPTPFPTSGPWEVRLRSRSTCCAFPIASA